MSNDIVNTPSVSYDLVAINGQSIPDVKKGSLTFAPSAKYVEHETEGGGKKIEVIKEGIAQGSVNFNGLMQSELQIIYPSLHTVSTMTIYDPFRGTTRTFQALLVIPEANKIIHDAVANAWSFGFTFEEIGDVSQ